jgi:putative transcriptional regulator
MREFGRSSLSLAGSLLIAHPNLLDPNFRRTVLFISANDPQEGSFGLVLNRPAEKTVADLLPDKDLGVLGKVPVFIGGPVSRDQLTFASFRWRVAEGDIECKTHLSVDEATELADEKFDAVRAFVGYSGWSKGQLEAELAQKAWLVQKPARDFLHAVNLADLWRQVMRSLGPLFRLLADAPDDPSRN